MSISASAVRINDRQFAVKVPQTGLYRVGVDDDSCVFSLNRDEAAIVEQEFLDSIYLQISRTEISHYDFGGREISIEEHRAKVKELHDDAGFEDADDNFLFYTVEQRIAWHNYNSAVRPVRKTIIEYKKVEVTKLSQSIPNVSVPHISPMHKISGDIFDTQYRIYRNGVVIDFVRDRLIKAGYTEVDERTNLPPKTFYFKNWGLEFAKFTNPITGTSDYLTIYFPVLKNYQDLKPMVGSFDEVMDVKNRLEEQLKLTFASKLDTITKMVDNPILLYEVISMLEGVVTKVYEIDPKVNSVMKRRSALETLNSIISKLQEAAKKD